jgi:hypothetical protein
VRSKAKPARKPAAKKAAKPARKPVVRKAAKPARRSPAQRVVSRRKARPVAIVRAVPTARSKGRAEAAGAAPARAAETAPFAPAITGASARHLALFEVVRARVTLHASLQGLPPGNGEQRVEPGRWTLRETLLHLIHVDREAIAALESALHGRMPDWAGETAEARDRRNDEGVAPLRGLDYGEALRRMQAVRQELMSALESLPEEPVTMWGREHALGRVVAGISSHDLFHANLIKHWRTTRDV